MLNVEERPLSGAITTWHLDLLAVTFDAVRRSFVVWGGTMLLLLGILVGLVALWLFISPLVIWFLRGDIQSLRQRVVRTELVLGDLQRKLSHDQPPEAPPPVTTSETEPVDREPASDVVPSDWDDEDSWVSDDGREAVPPESDGAQSDFGTHGDYGDHDRDPSATGDALTGISLEESLGTRWAVYVGGLALALGGVFLVHYTIEAGLLGPGVRLALGLCLAGLLISLGEWFRRTDRKLGFAVVGDAHVPSILTAAGTTTAFATVYAAHALFEYIGPMTAFVALGLIGIATMLAAALHGPSLAGLGLAGAYVTPLIVASTAPSPWALVLYLGIVACAALLLARFRIWLWLAVTAVAGACVWGVLMLAKAPQFGNLSEALAQSEWLNASYVHTLIQLCLCALIIGILPHMPTRVRPIVPDWIATACLGALAGLCVLVLSHASPLDDGWLAFAATVIIVLVGAAYASAPAAGGGILAGVIVVAISLIWPAATSATPVPYVDEWIGGALQRPDPVSSYLWVLVLGALPGFLVGLTQIWRAGGLSVSTAGLYALAATGVPLALLVISYMRISQFEGSSRFMIAGLLLGAAFWALCEMFLRRERTLYQAAPGVNQSIDDNGTANDSEEDGDRNELDEPRHVAVGSNFELTTARLATGAFACAGLAALSFALCVIVDRSLLKSALALSALGVAVVSTTRDIPILRHVVWVLGLGVLARVVGEPANMIQDVGRTPIFNWLLVAYGIPAIAFYICGRVLHFEREKPDLATQICDGLAVVFGSLLCFFQIRHLVHGGDPLAPSISHIEAGLFVFTALALAHVMFRHGQVLKGRVYDGASHVLGWGALVIAVVSLVFANNPYITGARIAGGPILSSLVLAYLLPGLMALYVARVSRLVRHSTFVTAAGVVGLALVFLYVSLEVRHIFQGEKIPFWHATSGAETWAYTVAWLGLGIGFLAYGFWRHLTMPRIVSAVLIVLACLKVVFVDLAGVSGLWRALSFLCLGVVLMGIGLVYQRVIFAPSRAAHDETLS